jgi:hypothetical protein
MAGDHHFAHQIIIIDTRGEEGEKYIYL